MSPSFMSTAISLRSSNLSSKKAGSSEEPPIDSSILDEVKPIAKSTAPRKIRLYEDDEESSSSSEGKIATSFKDEFIQVQSSQEEEVNSTDREDLNELDELFTSDILSRFAQEAPLSFSSIKEDSRGEDSLDEMQDRIASTVFTRFTEAAPLSFIPFTAPSFSPRPALVFGQEFWQSLSAEVDSERIVPPPVETGACPFWPDRAIGATQILVYIPSRLNGEPYNLLRLSSFLDTLRNKGTGFYKLVLASLTDEERNRSVNRPYWACFTMETIPGSNDKPFIQQQQMVSPFGYSPPRLIEAATSIILYALSERKRLYPNTYTRCQEKFKNWNYAIGKFEATSFNTENLSCLHIEPLDNTHKSLGLAGVKRYT